MTDVREPDNAADAAETATRTEPSIVDAPTPDAEAQFVAETTAHSRQTRIGWEVAVAAVVVVLIGAGIAYALLGRGDESPKPSGDASGLATVATPTPAADASTSASTSQTVATSPTPAPGGGTGGRTTRPADKPARPGEPLAELSGPPRRTVGMLVVPKGFKDATFSIVFEPFGWGPGGPDGGRLLIRISSSKPTNSSAKALDKDFKGRNASVWVTPPEAKVLVKGGTYTGVLTVRPQGDVGTLYLSDVKSAK